MIKLLKHRVLPAKRKSGPYFGSFEQRSDGPSLWRRVWLGCRLFDREHAPLSGQQRCIGELLFGPRHSITAYAEDWSRTLSTFEINLGRDGTVVDYGRASNVLDGPVSALHLVDILVRDQVNSPLAADEIVTTGTLTRALPVLA